MDKSLCDRKQGKWWMEQTHLFTEGTMEAEDSKNTIYIRQSRRTDNQDKKKSEAFLSSTSLSYLSF
jgi:hypothetical protein